MNTSSTKRPENFIAEINGHQIYRDGNVCHIWTDGVGWWGFDMTEEQARTTCQAVSNAQATLAADSTKKYCYTCKKWVMVWREQTICPTCNKEGLHD